jgi:hypothetical protein
MPRRRDQHPEQFDPVTNRRIELIDVLWMFLMQALWTLAISQTEVGAA